MNIVIVKSFIDFRVFVNRLIKLAKHPSLQRIGGETIWVAIGSGGSVLAMLVGVRLLTSVLSPSDYGLLALAVSISTAVQISVGLGIGTTATRFYSIAAESGGFFEYWKCMRRIYTAVFVLFSAASCLIGLFIAQIGVQHAFLWSGAIFWGGLLALDTAMDGPQNGARNRKLFCWHHNLFDWVRFPLAYLLIQTLWPSAWGALVAFIVASLLTLSSRRYFLRKLERQTKKDSTTPKDSSGDFSHRLLNYLYPVIFIGLFTWIQLFADRWALMIFGSKEDIGIYFAIYQLSFSPALHLTVFLMNLTGPVLFGASGNLSNASRHIKAVKTNHKLAGIMLVGFVLLFLVVRHFNQQIGTIFLGPLFLSHLDLLPWMLLSGGFYAIGQQLFMTVYMGLDAAKPLYFRGFIAISACVAVCLGGMWNGIVGVTFGLLAFSTIFLCGAFLFHWLERHRVLKSCVYG